MSHLVGHIGRRSGWLAGVAGALALVAAAAPAAATTPASATTPAAVRVPTGFVANSINWLNPRQGWVLGAIDCGGRACADVVGTTDAGASWHQVGRVGTTVPMATDDVPSGVTEVRFGTAQAGWAFAPLLYRTGNGGRTWSRVAIPGGARQVLALAAAPDATYVVTSDCAAGTGLCDDHPLRLWRRPSAGGSWTRIWLNLPISVSAVVKVHGPTVYVLDTEIEGTQPDPFYVSTDHGSHFAARTDPCDHASDIALVDVVPTSSTDVSVLCDGDAGFSKSVKQVYRSTDTGRTYTYSGTAGDYGIQSQLAVSPSGNLAISSWSDGSFIYINDTHRRWWKMIIGSGDGGAGFNDIVYVTGREAWVVFGPADMGARYGQVYVTRDAGRSWQLVAL